MKSLGAMNYADAIRFLYELRWFGLKLGLENTRKLAALAGNPQNELRFIHVAGTNGKGSTCAMLESIYRTAGLRVGLFTSPHLISFRERIQVDRQLISEADVVRLVTKLRGQSSEFRLQAATEPAGDGTPNADDAYPTFFEFVTVMALLYFAEQRCDLVIWETGLGGRLDATNIVTPLASVITNVQYDHQQWLGDTLSRIAAEKAGIIKPGVPVLTATNEPEALAVIQETAGRLGAPLTHITSDGASRLVTQSEGEITHRASLSLRGEHQRRNAGLAVAAVNALRHLIPVDDTQIRTGLSQLDWPGRLQLVTRPSGQKILLDGAHNVAGAKALRSALEEYFPEQRRTAILGVLEDKEWRRISETLSPLATRIFTVPVSSERAADASQLAEACRAANTNADVSTCTSLEEALRRCSMDTLVIVTGSLYLVGEALEILGCSSSVGSERHLNEWRPSPVSVRTVP